MKTIFESDSQMVRVLGQRQLSCLVWDTDCLHHFSYGGLFERSSNMRKIFTKRARYCVNVRLKRSFLEQVGAR